MRRCFPEQSRQFIAAAPSADPGRTAARSGSDDAAGRATIYVDRSASMVGYLNAQTDIDAYFSDLVSTLPQSLREMNVAAEHRAFGVSISEPIANPSELLRPAAFSGPESRESHIDTVLNQAADNRDEMSLIISDLWFSNNSVDTTALAALKPAIDRIIASGRAIGIYGIDAPFAGTIYDLPMPDGRLNGQFSLRGNHPLYLMVVGSNEQLARLQTRLTRNSQGWLSEGVADGSIHQALFTARPLKADAAATLRFEAGNARPVIAQESFTNFRGLRVQQFKFDPQAARQQRRAASAGTAPRGAPVYPSWRGPDPANFIPHAVWEGPTQINLRLWRRRGDGCSAQDWVALNALSGDWPRIEPGEQATVRLDPDLLGTALAREGDYLLTGEVRRLSIDREASSAAWMRQWSMIVRSGGFSVRDGTTFPTMNIDRLATILEDSVADQVERQNAPVTGFTVLIRSSGS